MDSVPEDIFRGFHSLSDGKDIRMWPATTFASRLLWPRPFTVYSSPGYSTLPICGRPEARTALGTPFIRELTSG